MNDQCLQQSNRLSIQKAAKPSRYSRRHNYRYNRVSNSATTDLVYDHMTHNLTPQALSLKYPIKLITIYKIL